MCLRAGKDVQAAIDWAKAEGGDTLMHLLERRETTLRPSPLIVTVAGARIVDNPRCNWFPHVRKSADHLAVAQALVEAGARTDSKDVSRVRPLYITAAPVSGHKQLCV
jgi:hypothetical protein